MIMWSDWHFLFGIYFNILMAMGTLKYPMNLPEINKCHDKVWFFLLHRLPIPFDPWDEERPACLAACLKPNG